MTTVTVLMSDDRRFTDVVPADTDVETLIQSICANHNYDRSDVEDWWQESDA